MSNRSESVRVCVRIRPLSTKEKQDGRQQIVFAHKATAEIELVNPEADGAEPPKKFTFDAAISPDATQMDVYNKAATDIVESVVNGFNGTIFAYGQTGAGKSHTMEGYSEPPEEKGIIPNSFKHIFDRIAAESNTKQFMVYASYLEIYNEEIRDLLASDPKNRLELKENLETGVYVKDLISRQVTGEAEIDAVMQQGKKNRSVGATLMNQTSSRSHSMFTITVEACSNAVGVDGKQHICVGKLNLVDLAGSERQAKTGATGDRMKEATKINLSLSALGNVISALVDGKSQHIPYRDSKLTRLLQDSLGGNAKTVMIANCGPADYNYNETLSTLRYANRAKNIKNKPKINEDPKDAKIREYQEKIKELREALAAQEKNAGSLGGGGGGAFAGAAEGKASQPQIVERIVEKTVVKARGRERGGAQEAGGGRAAREGRAQAESAGRDEGDSRGAVAHRGRARAARERAGIQGAGESRARAQESRDGRAAAAHGREAHLGRQGHGQGREAGARAARRAAQDRGAEAAGDAARARARGERGLEHAAGGAVLDAAGGGRRQDAQAQEAVGQAQGGVHRDRGPQDRVPDREGGHAGHDPGAHAAAQAQARAAHALCAAGRSRIAGEARPVRSGAGRVESRATGSARDVAASEATRCRAAARAASKASTRAATDSSTPMNVRWRADNVATLDMEMPERRTKDFDYGGSSNPSMNFYIERVGCNEDGPEISFENDVDAPRDRNGSATSNDNKSGKATSNAKEQKEREREKEPSKEAVAPATSRKKASPSDPSMDDSPRSDISEKAGGAREKASSSKSSSKRPPTARYRTQHMMT
ncbi:hypothetical protein PINS_up005609 [Pythium insidiosum]|nr:hypothetical protein PINS_up005609 [Pythium insidiosum]